MVSAWPESPNAISAEKSAGVRDGMEGFALTTTKTRPDIFGQYSGGVQDHWHYSTPVVPENLIRAGAMR